VTGVQTCALPISREFQLKNSAKPWKHEIGFISESTRVGIA